jgi:hypothetical protein
MTEPTEKSITKVEAWFTSKELAEILQQDWDCVFSVLSTMAYLHQLSVISAPGGYWSYRLKLPLKGDFDPSVIKSRGDRLRRTLLDQSGMPLLDQSGIPLLDQSSGVSG